jgi:maleylpyruvate isomerase
MTRTDVTVTLPLMGAGTEFFDRIVGALPDDALRDPSGLPGWSRAHVVGHLARNAEALTRLATWARTGVETPMYAHSEQRNADIEASAQGSAETLRTELATTGDEPDSALAALDEHTWHAPVRSAQGRAIPAAEIPWMRVREVWLHAVDLDAGATVADVPGEVLDLLLDDVTGVLSGRDGCPAALLVPTDRDRAWSLGAGGDAVEVRGTAADVVGWLVGRADGKDLTTVGGAVLPAPPRWL